MKLMFAAAASAVLLTGCVGSNTRGPGYAYDYNRYDPADGGYYADRYYVDNPRYRERRLGNNDRIYAGRDGRYYCRRNDGTTGLIVGGIAGGALGTAISPGGSGLLGAVLGGAGGALLGREIDRNNVRCR